MARSAPANYDSLAGIYACLERLTFGHALDRRRTRYLAAPALARARHALILGDGDGRFTAALVSHYPELRVTAIDASAAMLEALARRVARQTPGAAIELHCADARLWQPPNAAYDLVVTHFFFDCLTSAEVAELVARVAQRLTANACWLISDFAIPASGVRALLVKALVRALYFAQRLLTGSPVARLPDHRVALETARFSRTANEPALGGALYSELWQRG